MAIQIAVAALKGGVGKSTVALNLATCLHRDGYRVLIVDADKQGTCGTWAAVAAEGGYAGPPVVAVEGKALRRDLPGLAKGYDAVVIDSPPYAGPEARAAMLMADMILLPTTPGAADAWALQTTIDVVAEVRGLRPEIEAVVVLNRADRTKLTKTVREAIGGFGLPTLGVELSVRVTYGEATLAGRGVVDYAPGSPAAREIEQLTAAVLAVLRGKHGQESTGTEPPTKPATPGVAAALAEPPGPDGRLRGAGPGARERGAAPGAATAGRRGRGKSSSSKR